MEIIKSKRGRPATGRRNDGTLYLRLPVEKREEVKRLVREFLGGREPEKEVVSYKEDPYNGIAPDNAFKGMGGPKMPVGPKDPVVKANASEIAALLDDVQALTDEVAGLKVELEECRLMTYDDKMGYWKARALKAEAYADSKNE